MKTDLNLKKGGEILKLKICLVSLAIACLLIPHYAGASTVFETTGWIQESTGLTFDFVADTAPFTYAATLSDLSEAPFFGFEFLFLSITTSTENVDSIVGPGSFSFLALCPQWTYLFVFIGHIAGEAGNEYLI